MFLASIDWGASWQRHHAWASRFAAAGNEVFFVENTGFRGLRVSDAGRVLSRLRCAARPKLGTPPPEGIRVVSPLVLPPTAGAFRGANRALFVPRLVKQLRSLGLRERPLVFAYLPTSTTVQALDAMKPGLVVYDCVDNFEGHPTPPRGLDRTENQLLSRAACVLTTSPYLYRRLAGRHPSVHELHHGVDDSFFTAATMPRMEYKRFAYFGSLWHAIEYRYVRALAEAGFEVTLLGPATEPLPPLPASVRHLPPVAAAELPAAIAGFDALILPYADTPYNQGVTPAKTFECLATGKPVIASAIGGLGRFKDHFYIEHTPESWVRAARELPKTETLGRRQARIELARKHTTQIQFEKLQAILQASER